MSLEPVVKMADDLVYWYVNALQQKKLNVSTLVLGVLVGQIHEAATQNNKQRVLEILIWMEDEARHLPVEFNREWEEGVMTLRLAINNAPNQDFPKWAQDALSRPIRDTFGHGPLPKRITYKQQDEARTL